MTTLEQSRKERNIIETYAERSRREQREKLCDNPEFGDLLRKLLANLHHYKRLDQAADFVAYINKQCAKWLLEAPIEFRYEALSACSEQIAFIKKRHGLDPLSDPLPDQPDNVFYLCKRAMGL